MQQTILAIESSCDETAAAIFTTTMGVRSSVLFSQIDLHKQYGGVVPEIASRSHIEKINGIVQGALDEAQCTLADITAIAVTNRPGLPGSLLVGLCFAKAIAYARNIKLIGVDHIEGHIASAFIENQVPFPHLCLTVSGGHTSIYYVRDFGVFECVATTVDDAAGEAFDKVAKLLELGYPGGPIIEKYARARNFHDFLAYPRLKMLGNNFSFSGLKTAVLYDLIDRGWYDPKTKKITPACNQDAQEQVCSSFLCCVGDILQERVARVFKAYPDARALTFVGGVACNTYLADRLRVWAERRHKHFFVPVRTFCTDNAAMIAYVGHYRAQRGQFADLTLDIEH
jgi:N6-L-threonylcarbamoyladenine synthase